MNTNAPNSSWLIAWALLQLLSVPLSMMAVSTHFESLSFRSAILSFATLVLVHWGATYGLLLAANVATDRPAIVAVCVTATLLVVTTCPTEPRMAQTFAAIVFLGIVFWQTLLKAMEE